MSIIFNGNKLRSDFFYFDDSPVKRSCPNCGRICWEYELNNHNTIQTLWGGSTLYGVCYNCAKLHAKQDINRINE